MRGKVLVVDDEESIRFTFHTFLSDEGYEVSTAVGLCEATALLGRHEYDLVFLDIILDGASGIDGLKEIKETDVRIPVVMITGAPSVETAASAVRYGAFDYISKPIYQDELLRITRSAISKKAVADANERILRNALSVCSGIREGLLLLDGEGRITQVNEALLEICPFRGDDPTGFFIDDLGLDCSGECIHHLRRARALQTFLSAEAVECRSPRREGQFVSLSLSPLFDNRGRFLGLVALIRAVVTAVDAGRPPREGERFHSLVGGSTAMRRVYSLVERLASVDSTVLVIGESGTGKELVAEALHCGGPRARQPLVKVNCSALSESLLESELFGHVRGAFTGAVCDRIGRFEKADGGTIFLDEIGDVSTSVQLRLLRVLERKEIERVGDSRPRPVDIRIVTATNRNLPELVRQGMMREDLYYRLKVIEIEVPPLRERCEDIPLLAAHFLERFNLKFGKFVRGFSGELTQALAAYHWPGNVRELEHVIEGACLICSSDIITLRDVPFGLASRLSPPRCSGKVPGEDEHARLLEALERSEWNKTRAAELLGMSRRTIYRKIKEHKILEQLKGDPPPVGIR